MTDSYNGWESSGPPPFHVYPVNDMRSHVTEGELCPCLPRVRRVDGEDAVVVHNSYDGRELGQVCRTAIDLLALALTDHNHRWSDDLRDRFEHAIQLLDMHYPDIQGQATPSLEG